MLCSLKTYCIISTFLSIVVIISDVSSDLMQEMSSETTEFDDYITTSDVTKTYGINNDNVSIGAEDIESSWSMSVRRKIEYGMLKEKCMFYKHGKEIDLEEIADVWQVVYFQLDEDIPCFRIYIKRTTEEDKKAYMEKYGSFSDKVNWTACDLEIRSGDKRGTQRRHFLQRGNKGIMDNVIILEHNVKGNESYSLHMESPDQWLVVQSLLLMRDCGDGDVVVFARVPHQPRRGDVTDALALFGEYAVEGKMPCH